MEEHKVEVLMFYLNVEKLKLEIDDGEIKKAVAFIWDTFLKGGTPLEVSIDQEIKKPIKEKLENNSFDKHLFDTTQNIVFDIITGNIIPRFKRSKHYADMVQLKSELSRGKHKKEGSGNVTWDIDQSLDVRMRQKLQIIKALEILLVENEDFLDDDRGKNSGFGIFKKAFISKKRGDKDKKREQKKKR